MERSVAGLSEFVEMLDKKGEILRVKKEIDPQHEIAMMLTQLDQEDNPAVVFENVKGYDMPVVGNLLGAQRRLAMALFTDEVQLSQGYLPHQDRFIPPVLQDSRPERRIISAEGNFNIMDHLPVLTHYAKDSAPFITCGMASAKDPLSGGTRRGLHRLDVRGPKEIGISLVNPPLSSVYAANKKAGTPMEIAVAVGVDPAALVSSVFKIGRDQDKLEAAGGLSGEPVLLEKCATVDLNFPAQAEVVIEGFIDPRQKERECVLGEVSGYYLPLAGPTIQVMAVTLRPAAMFQALLPQGLEVDHLLTLIHRFNIIPKMKAAFPGLIDLHFVPGTFGSNLVMSTDSDNVGENRRALVMALSFPNVKKAVIVNSDVDPTNYQEVEWAQATRFQPDKDLILIPSLGGQVIDPSTNENMQTAKIGIDATRPLLNGFEKIAFPEGISLFDISHE